MNYTYNDKQTLAYFSVMSLNNLRQQAPFNCPHPWFTILVIDKFAGKMTIDDNVVPEDFPAAVFITPGQHFLMNGIDKCAGFAVSFNKEFYCVEYHDKEVSCNGLLFVNNFRVVKILLNSQQLAIYQNTMNEMAGEFEQNDLLQSEMLKNLLKNLLIRSNRLFRAQNTPGEPDNSNVDFARKFSQLVEKHFRTMKQVEEYAGMMNIAPATLAKKLQKYGIESPSRIIRNRIITEAKRLLIYTDKNVKEIACLIGYDDQHYFSRLFNKEANTSPSEYRKQYQKL